MLASLTQIHLLRPLEPGQQDEGCSVREEDPTIPVASLPAQSLPALRPLEGVGCGGMGKK